MRLKRMGTKKRPYYRIVVQDNRIAATSKTFVKVGRCERTVCEVRVEAGKTVGEIAL